MSDLFTTNNAEAPLADRMRPETLDDVLGQEHIVGEGRLLRRAILRDRLSSVIFYGPPGTGKTSLAHVIANTTKGSFESLNAVLAGIKDIREAIDRAGERRKLYDRRTILFVDEVHRWNKAQQDALLPWVENGTIILVGATTENPFFEVNRALVSRSRIFQLRTLTKDALFESALRAVRDEKRGYGKWKVTFGEGALEHLVDASGGDVRCLLNALELAIESVPPVWPPPLGDEIVITLPAAEESIQKRVVLYDKDGDYHFDTISAFIKSIRGSDPDAALYWLAKMVAAGEDPDFIFRRLLILASEDVGLADPYALSVVVSCAESFSRIGFPEGNFPLAHAVLYLATAPKSNSTLGYFDAKAVVEKEAAEVPNHLRDASRDKESFAHGEGYIYPHAYRDHWTAQQYLPGVLQGKIFYTPSAVGYEGALRSEVLKKREVQAAVLLEAARNETRSGDGEVLTWRMEKKGQEGWYRRLNSGRSASLAAARDMLFENAALKRHSRLLVLGAEDGLLLWEGSRRTPEGSTCAVVGTEEAKNTLLRYAAPLDDIEKPQIAVFAGVPPAAALKELFDISAFDAVMAREPWSASPTPAAYMKDAALSIRAALAQGGVFLSLQTPPNAGQKLSSYIPSGASALRSQMASLEDEFFAERAASLWCEDDLLAAFTSAGFTVEIKKVEVKEARVVGVKEIDLWFDVKKSPWGKFLGERMDKKDFAAARELLKAAAQSGPLEWKREALFMRAI